jgi:hypothetical protein
MSDSGPKKSKEPFNARAISSPGSISTAASYTSETCSWEAPTYKTSDSRSTCKLFVAVAMLLGLGVLIGALGATAFIQWGSTVHTPYASVPAPSVVPEAYMNSKPLNNSCLIPNLDIPVTSDKPQTFNACGFVIQSTDEVWNLRGDVDEAINKYFHEDYIDAGSWGQKIIGKKALRDAVLKEMRAFPDIKIHITDCVCKGNDINGYKCAMPDILEGTNLGPSAYGPPTGRYARWSGMVQSFVKKDPRTGQWQYWAEWGVHDEWALIQQLGLDFSKVQHPVRDLELFHDCAPLVRFSPDATYDLEDGAAQQAERFYRLRGKSS